MYPLLDWHSPVAAQKGQLTGSVSKQSPPFSASTTLLLVGAEEGDAATVVVVLLARASNAKNSDNDNSTVVHEGLIVRLRWFFLFCRRR